jgi:hypothetical protein
MNRPAHFHDYQGRYFSQPVLSQLNRLSVISSDFPGYKDLYWLVVTEAVIRSGIIYGTATILYEKTL